MVDVLEGLPEDAEVRMLTHALPQHRYGVSWDDGQDRSDGGAARFHAFGPTADKAIENARTLLAEQP